ncbi:MAG: glutamine ABC transporter substrate-binding protein GlnH [Anaerolineales bacterium]
MKTKSFLFSVIFMLIVSMLAGCASQPTVALTPRLQQIKDSGKLVVGTAITAPFEYRDSNGELVGMDVEIAKVIAAKIGVPVEWKEMAFGDLLPTLQDGKVDMVIAGMYITDARKEVVDMTAGYADTGLALVTLASDATITKPDDLTGKIACVKTGSTGAKYIQALNDSGAQIKVQEYADTISSLEDLSKGYCDTAMNDKINSLQYIKTHPDLKVASEVLQPAQVGMSVKKGDAELLALLNDSIQEMKANGELAKLYNVWVLGQ